LEEAEDEERGHPVEFGWLLRRFVPDDAGKLAAANGEG
jgi:hypothetical protein